MVVLLLMVVSTPVSNCHCCVQYVSWQFNGLSLDVIERHQKRISTCLLVVKDGVNA